MFTEHVKYSLIHIKGHTQMTEVCWTAFEILFSFVKPHVHLHTHWYILLLDE